MLEKIKDRLFQIDSAVGVEIQISPNGEYLACAVEVFIRKGQLIKKREYALKPVENLVKELPSDIPVSVSISGKGVLIKKISSQEYAGNYLDLLFPNVNPNDFSISVIPTGEFVWIALFRKSTLEEITGRLITYGLNILDISIGVKAMESILPFINMKVFPEITTDQYHISLHSGIGIESIKNIQSAEDFFPDEYTIGDQYIKSSFLLSFASAICIFTRNIADLPVLDQRMVKIREDFKYAKIFKIGYWALLICTLFILLVNFLVYQHYFKLNQELQVSENLLRVRKAELKKSTASFEAKLNILKQTGWDQSANISFLADRIAALVPEDVLLLSLEINPISKGQFSEDRSLIFKKDTIMISGTCSDPEDLSVFLGNLKNSNCVGSVIVTDYTYKREEARGYFNMQILAKR